MLLPNVNPLEKLQNLSRVKLTFFHPSLKSRVIHVSECIKSLFSLIVCFDLCKSWLICFQENLQKLLSPQKTRLLGDTKMSLAHKEEEMRQLVEKMQRLEDA